MKKGIFFFIGVLTISFLTTAAVNQGKAKQEAPDLVITNVKVDTSNIKKDKNIKVIYTIKNQGKSAAKESAAAIQLLNKSNKNMGKAIKGNVPALPPNASYTTTVTYPIKAKGDYVINATADYNDKIVESNEFNNNNNTVKFSVGFGL